MKIDEPGIYDMPSVEYHADPCPEPSLSAGIANELVTKSPLHAWNQHPRLNPDYRPEVSETFDRGTAAHAYLLEGERAFATIEAADWRTKAAKEARAEARANGRVPILERHHKQMVEMAEAIRARLANHEAEPRPLGPEGGKPEQSIVWKEKTKHGDVWCRARADFLHDEADVIDDLKTTAASAHPESWSRTMFGSGGDLRAAFYLRGLRAVRGLDSTKGTYRYVVAENYRPYAVCVYDLDPATMMIGEKKAWAAIEAWAACLASKRWPAYPARTCSIMLPSWEETKWLAREEREMEESS